MSTTAALIEGHWITARYPDAACQCGAQFEWNDRDKAHALHLLDVARAAERERIARLLDEQRDKWAATSAVGHTAAFEDAVRIAREGA